MSNIAIRVEGLGKMYRIGGKQERYRTLRDTLTDAFAAPFRRAGSLLRGQAYGAADLKEEIWALKDVSFEVKHGEVVGIIGRNGAGKSTLLKILSRITEPTEGYADVYGRVGSLLEVGTGFHPELTGRENIYLNGAILGMSRSEIDRKFDEIVAFAEIEKFIDTPVKHYSSGMGLRLGFAVAAHLEPEILVVDEVLAVGDAQFQKKCLGKMSDVAGEGRTVLFVSHDMRTIQALCPRTILLDAGSVVGDSTSHQVVDKYLNLHAEKDQGEYHKPSLSGQIEGLKISRLRLLDEYGNSTRNVRSGRGLQIELSFTSTEYVHRPEFEFLFRDSLLRKVAVLSTWHLADDHPDTRQGGNVKVIIQSLPFVPGTYHISAMIGGLRRVWDNAENAISFSVLANEDFHYRSYPEQEHGTTLIHPAEWSYDYS